MIPKTIHFCWFGKGPKSKFVKRCIANWKKVCPDYQIIEWNEDNFDLRRTPYGKQAFDAQKWAFVADVARLWIVYEQGGIYLDTDVELTRSWDDLLENEAFFGLEDNGSIATGLGFGAEKGNPVVWEMLQGYEGVDFRKPDGSLDLTTCPVRNTASVAHLLPAYWNPNEITKLPHATIYPREWFCPLSADGTEMRKTANTHSIHWYSASWLTKEQMVVHRYRVFRGKWEKRLGKRWGGYIARAAYLFLPKKRAILKRM